jgi:hypothetical protein
MKGFMKYAAAVTVIGLLWIGGIADAVTRGQNGLIAYLVFPYGVYNTISLTLDGEWNRTYLHALFTGSTVPQPPYDPSVDCWKRNDCSLYPESSPKVAPNNEESSN